MTHNRKSKKRNLEPQIKKTAAKSSRLPKMKIAYEIKEQFNKRTYSKTAYNKNAVAIFIIANDFANEKKFINLKKIDVSIFKTMYQLMFDSKKKIFYKTIMQILISNTSDFIDQSPAYFLMWLNKFREGPHLTSEKKDFASRLFSSRRIFKGKSRVEGIRERSFREIEEIQRSVRKKTTRANKPSIKDHVSSLYGNPFQKHDEIHEKKSKKIEIPPTKRFKNENVIYFSKKNSNNRNHFQNDGELNDDRQYDHSARNYIHKKKNRNDFRFVSRNHRRLQIVTKKKSFQTRRRRNENDDQFVFRKNRRLQIVNSEKSLYRQHLRFKNSFRKNRKSSRKKNRRNIDRRNTRQIFSYSRSRSRSKNHENKNEKRRYEKQSSINRKYERQENSLLHYFKYERKKSRSRRRFSDSRSKTKFKFFDIMKFNPKNTPIAFFIKRFQHITEIEEKNAILRIFFMCLKKSVLE